MGGKRKSGGLGRVGLKSGNPKESAEGLIVLTEPVASLPGSPI